MISMRLSQAAEILAAEMHGKDVSFTGVVIDSRQAGPGNLFAALPGSRSDGHDFIERAERAGAVASLVSRDPAAAEGPWIRVKDVQRALGRLAKAWRSEHETAVVAVTGSNGKTTTCRMIASILAEQAPCLATRGNYNNELGLPLTLFELEGRHEFAVLEMGAARAGDIAYLCGIGHPKVGLVTNIGPAHLQGFGDEEGVARAKAEIYESLPADGIAVVNGDDPWSSLFRERAASRTVISFGFDPRHDVSLSPDGTGRQVSTPEGGFHLELGLPGHHNRANALAATAVGVALGVPLKTIARGLASVRPVTGRLNIVQADGGWTVIDDTYNANPASLYAALQVLTSQGDESWLVLGDMKELGVASRKLHAEMGEAARALGVSRVFTTGDMSHATADAFGNGGRHFASRSELIDCLCSELEPGVTCLVKGSRSMGMERVVEAITGSCLRREAG